MMFSPALAPSVLSGANRMVAPLLPACQRTEIGAIWGMMHSCRGSPPELSDLSKVPEACQASLHSKISRWWRETAPLGRSRVPHSHRARNGLAVDHGLTDVANDGVDCIQEGGLNDHTLTVVPQKKTGNALARYR